VTGSDALQASTAVPFDEMAKRDMARWGQLEKAADQAIEACGGDAREAVRALIVANHFLETELEKLRAAASPGYARGKLLPRDRKDWYD
jgi:hypothetical protein